MTEFHSYTLTFLINHVQHAQLDIILFKTYIALNAKYHAKLALQPTLVYLAKFNSLFKTNLVNLVIKHAKDVKCQTINCHVYSVINIFMLKISQVNAKILECVYNIKPTEVALHALLDIMVLIVKCVAISAINAVIFQLTALLAVNLDI